MPLAIGTLITSIFTVAGAFTGLIVLFSVAVHRKFAVLAVFGSVTLATNALFFVIRPEQDRTF